jgi:hypothetical protein
LKFRPRQYARLLAVRAPRAASPPPHRRAAITSSARASSDGETVRPEHPGGLCVDDQQYN